MVSIPNSVRVSQNPLFFANLTPLNSGISLLKWVQRSRSSMQLSHLSRSLALLTRALHRSPLHECLVMVAVLK